MARQPTSPFRWIVLVLSFLLSFVAVGWVFLALPIFFPAMGEDLGVGPAAVQFIFGAISLVLIVTNFAGGVAGVRFSLRGVIGLGGLCLGASAVLRGLIPTYGAALLASGLAGCGVGLAEPNFIAALSRWFPSRELGLANGARIAGVTAGGGTAQGIIAPMLMETLGGWQSTQLAMGMIVLLVSGVWLVVYRDPRPEDTEDSREENEHASLPDTDLIPLFQRMLSVRDMVILAGIMVLLLFSAQSFMGMLPTWLDGMVFVPEGQVGFYSSLFFWFSLVGQLTLPALSDVLGRRKPILYLSVGLAVTGTLLVVLATSTVWVVAAGSVGGLGGGAIFPLLLAIPGEHPEVGPALSGLGVGFLFSLGQVGGTIGPPITGYAFSLGGLTASALTAAVPYLMLALLIPWMAETGPVTRSSGVETKSGP